jgi:hypothetical protein
MCYTFLPIQYILLDAVIFLVLGNNKFIYGITGSVSAHRKTKPHGLRTAELCVSGVGLEGSQGGKVGRIESMRGLGASDNLLLPKALGFPK